MSLTNKKNTKYLLIAAVLAIWGTIAFKVIRGLGGDTEQIPGSSKTGPVATAAEEPDTFSLIASYPDPFIPEKEVKPVIKTEETKSVASAASIPKMVEVIPTIKYKGFITNPTLKKKMALISINGKSYQAYEKEKIEGFSIIHIDAGYIDVAYKGAKQKITTD